MRALGAGMLAVVLSAAGPPWAAGAALAAPAAAVTVPAFAAQGELAIFAPEVARAVAAALAQSGVEVAATGTPVAGRMEPVGAEGVRLVATVAGRSAQVQGPMEEIDRLASELAARLVPLVPPATRHVALASRTATGPRDGRGRRGAVENAESATASLSPGTGAGGLGVLSATPTAAAQPTTATHEDPSPPRATESAPVPPAPPPDMATAPPPAVRVTPPPLPPAVVREPPPAVVAPPRETTGDPLYPPLPPSAPARRAAPPARAYGRYRPLGLALLHTVRTPEGCPQWPTLAAREVMERQVMIPTTPGGCGITPLTSATAETVRAGLTAVVMATLENVRFESSPGGYRPVGRLRLVVVRDGRPVLAQSIDLISHPLTKPDVATASYDLVAAGFTRLAGPLQAVLVDAR